MSGIAWEPTGWMEKYVFRNDKMDCSKASIVVCSIVRNAERGLRRNIPVIRELCTRFRDYRVVVFENDSRDGTVGRLQAWAADDPKVTVFCSTLGIRTIPSQEEVTCNPFFSRSRIVKMAGFRNQYLAYIEKQGWNPDLLMVVDLDVDRLDLSYILTSFGDTPEWDAVTAYGYSLSPRLTWRYHDTYALVEEGMEDVPQTEESIKSASYRFGKMRPTDSWVPVFSAFGGLAIYRYECIRGLRYQCLDNADPRVAVRCEHFSLYRQMRERGYTRVYINPAMRLKYQRLSFKIVWGSIRRR